MSFTEEQIDQAKDIADLMTALGKSLANSGNPRASAFGEILARTGDTQAILSDMAKLESASSEFQAMLDKAVEIAAEMVGGSVGVAAMEHFILANGARAMVIGSFTAAFPIAGTLLLGASYFGAAWLGSTVAGGMYKLTKTGIDLLSPDPAYVPDMGADYDPDKFPNAHFLEVTEINAVFEGYALEPGSEQYFANEERLADREFVVKMQREISDYNFSLASLVKPGTGFLYNNPNGMLTWNGGGGAFQSYAFEGGGLNIFDSSSSWQSTFNMKMQNVMDAGKSMQNFIDSNFGRADKLLGGSAKELSKKVAEQDNQMQEAFGEFTPLVFDLSGNGIVTRSIFDKVRGFEFIPGEKDAYHGWLGHESGFLALDRDGNGTIDNGTELFGSATEDGFTVLRRLDSNKDGRIDAADELFDKLLVWQDKNQNTISETEELISVQEAGIKSISLEQVESVYRPDKNGNTIKWISEYLMESGETREIADVYFRYSKPYSTVSDQLTAAPSDAALEQQTQKLVTSMAAFSPPASSEILRPTNSVTSLNVPLAAI